MREYGYNIIVAHVNLHKSSHSRKKYSNLRFNMSHNIIIIICIKRILSHDYVKYYKCLILQCCPTQYLWPSKLDGID